MTIYKLVLSLLSSFKWCRWPRSTSDSK